MQQLEIDTLKGESQIFKRTFHLKKENSVIIFCSKPYDVIYSFLWNSQ